MVSAYDAANRLSFQTAFVATALAVLRDCWRVKRIARFALPHGVVVIAAIYV